MRYAHRGSKEEPFRRVEVSVFVLLCITAGRNTLRLLERNTLRLLEQLVQAIPRLLPPLPGVRGAIAPTHLRVHCACNASAWGGMDQDLRLQLSEEGADAERLAALTGYLRSNFCSLTWRM